MRRRLGSEGGDQFVVGAVQEGRLIGTAGFYREEGLDQVLLSVATTQKVAFGLYCALGFAIFGYEPRSLRIGDQFIDEQYLVLRLKNDGPVEKACHYRA